MSLHGNPVVGTASLPDGREVQIRVGIAEDGYVADRELDTVGLEVSVDGSVTAAVDTILNASQVDEAHHLFARIRDGLASGELEPTVKSLEPLADSLL